MHAIQSPALRTALTSIAGRAIQTRAAGDGNPFIVALFTTNRCNCKCASCLWRHNDWKDTPLEVLKRFYREAREEGFLATALTGGEPFLRKDLGELTHFLKHDVEMPTLLFTTGWFLKRRMHEVLPNIDMLMISLDSPHRERHDAIRGLPGLYDRVIEAVGLVKSSYPDLSLQLNCCVQRGIEPEIDDMIALVERLGVRISFDVITEQRNASEGQSFTETSVGLPLPELQRVCRTLAQKKRDGAPIVNSDRYFQYFADGRPGYRCHLPKLVMWVDGRGYVEDCLNLDQPIADIRTRSVREILELPAFRQIRADGEACSTCSSPTMVDTSHVWEDPSLLFESGGLRFG